MRRYIGAGHYIPGVPARDIEEDEFRDLPAGVRGHIEESGLYERVKDPPRAKAGEEAPTENEARPPLSINQAAPSPRPQVEAQPTNSGVEAPSPRSSRAATKSDQPAPPAEER